MIVNKINNNKIFILFINYQTLFRKFKYSLINKIFLTELFFY